MARFPEEIFFGYSLELTSLQGSLRVCASVPVYATGTRKQAVWRVSSSASSVIPWECKMYTCRGFPLGIVVAVATGLLSFLPSARAHDVDGHRVQIGMQFVNIRFDEPRESPVAFGGLASYYLIRGGKALAIDGHLSYCFDDVFHLRALMQVGIKGEVRNETIGVFAKMRPGFVSLRTLGTFSAPQGLADPFYRFALDLGGGVQWYVRAPVVLRMDFGANLIPFGGVVNASGLRPPVRLGLTGNPQICWAILFGF